MKKILLVFSAMLMLACSSEETSENSITENNSQENLKASSIQEASFIIRFNLARVSRGCESGFGICSMKRKREIEEEKRRRELEETAQHDVGIYQANSILAPIIPNDDFQGGIMDVIYDENQLINSGTLELDIKLAQAPTTAPAALLVEESLFFDIDGKRFTLAAGNYQYNSRLGSNGGYTITINN